MRSVGKAISAAEVHFPRARRPRTLFASRTTFTFKAALLDLTASPFGGDTERVYLSGFGRDRSLGTSELPAVCTDSPRRLFL